MPLPDPDLHLRESCDSILNSRLGRLALQCRDIPGFPVFLRDLLQTIFRLVQSCHMPEFTDHGLPHLCSLVGRISEWTCAPREGAPVSLCDLLGDTSPEGDEAAVLLMATLFHDMGMLSQRPEDLGPRDMDDRPAGAADIPAWVRRTHVKRLRGLLTRSFNSPPHDRIIQHPLCDHAIRVAEAHSAWPWEEAFSQLSGREQGLAAVLAVADLLDEDTNRCDTPTLVAHRQGTVDNFGHWIRHTLTSERILVQDGVIRVKLVRPPGTDGQLDPIFAAIRNHFQFSRLYLKPLGFLKAGLLRVDCFPKSGSPNEEALQLSNWESIPWLGSQDALKYCLFTSFMPLALRDRRRIGENLIDKTRDLDMEEINLDDFYKVRGSTESRSPYEQTVNALLSDN